MEPTLDPKSPASDIDARLRALESYQPQPISSPSLRDSEPYLFNPIQVVGDLHPNGDICIEDLTDSDLDLPIDFA
ncbi:MAG: hypothetical protein RL748_3927 [Pseudomonadota bacterium]